MRGSFGSRTTFISCIVVGLFLSANASYAELVGAWTLDEGQGTDIRDSSGNNHDGIAVDPEWVDGKRGKAILFDENSETVVEIPDEDEAFTLTEYTLTAWIKASRTHAGWQGQTLGYLEASSEERQFAPLHDELAERLRGQCVQCLHCLPCPQEIDVPNVILNLEYVEFYSGSRWSEQYNRELYARRTAKASDCIECEVCLERCPFGVDIIGKMRRAVEIFEAA